MFLAFFLMALAEKKCLVIFENLDALSLNNSIFWYVWHLLMLFRMY